MSDITALIVNFIPVKNNFIYLHSKLLSKFKNSNNSTGCISINHDQKTHHGSCYSTSFNGNGENAFNISASYANSLSLKEKETVIISSAHNLKSLKSLHVTPLSSDDWDILENSAETVQSTLLNQIRVVFAHQHLTIWVSKSISLMIHIDQLSENNHCGKLEQFTEVIVSTEVKSCDICSSSGISLSAKTDKSWNFSLFKDILSLVTMKETSTEKESIGDVPEEEFPSLGVFRCFSLNALEFDVVSQLSTYPYNVFISKKYIRNEWVLDQCKNGVLCRLQNLPFVSSKSSKEDKSDTNEDISLLNGSNQEIYTYVHFLEDVTTFHSDAKFRMANSYPTIFLSDIIQKYFNTRLNTKVRLDVVTKRPTTCDVTEINFSVINDDNSHTAETYTEEIKSYFSCYTQIYDTVIINNGCLQNFLSQTLYFTFNPANLPFVEMSYDDIQKCNFVFVERKLSNNFDIVEEPPFSSNLLSFRFYHDIILNLRSTLLLELGFLQSHNIGSSIVNSNHVILEGENGSGKSSLVKILADELRQSNFGVFVKIVECRCLKGKLIHKLKTIFESIFKECIHFQPSVIIFDDLDVLFATSKQNNQHTEQSVSSYTNRLSALLCDIIRTFSSHRITVLATATNLADFPSNLHCARGAPVFSIKYQLPVLDQNMRQDSLIQILISKHNVTIEESALKAEFMESVMQRLEGYCIQDISDLVDRVYFETIKRQMKVSHKMPQAIVTEEDINTAVSDVVPVSLKGVNFHKNSNLSWNDVGGLEAAKQLLTEILIWPSKYPKVFKQCPLKMQSGVLLYGAPGSGKTLLAGAVAGESSLNFISIKGPELLSKFVGESEEGVRNTFRRAQNAKPCILFFDEFESLAPRRGNDITGVTDRVVNQLLTELDGVESISGVWVLAATSRPDLIDPALLRPGRLGSMVYCPLPDQNDRLSILQIICSSNDLHEDVELDEIAQLTDGYTGADLKAIFYAAYMKNSHTSEIPTQNDPIVEEDRSKIHMESLVEAVKETKPSLKLNERLNYEKIYRRFSQKDEKIGIELEKQRVTYA